MECATRRALKITELDNIDICPFGTDDDGLF